MHPPNCAYETFTIHTSSLGANSNTAFTATLTSPLKDVVEASIISASIRRPDVVHFHITNTLVTGISAATINHAPLSRPLVSGEAVTITGHTAGTNADLILNAGYTVTSTPTSPTQTLLTADATGTLPVPMTLSLQESVAANGTDCTITFSTPAARQLYAGETVIITGFTGTAAALAMNGTFIVGSPPTATPLLTADLTKVGGGMTGGTYNTGSPVADTQPTPGIYNTGTVLGTTTSVVAHTSNVVYIRAEELQTNFDDFAAAGQPAVSSGAAQFNFPTGSNILRRCFGAIYNFNSQRFSYKDRYEMTSEYIDPIHRLDKLQITLYDANGVQLDSAQTDGINYITFRFKCKRKNLC